MTAGDQQQYRTVDSFDRRMGALTGLPDVTHTKPSTVQVQVPLVGDVQTITIQTFRQKERGDTIFIVCASSEGLVRLVLPPEAAEVIARQRGSATTKNRKRAARAEAARRKAAGIEPAFLKGKKKPRPSPKKETA